MTRTDEARAFFDAIAGRYDRVYAPPSDESRARMARVLGALPPGARILDLGVGTGREVAALLDAGHDVTGLDVSAEMLARCARRSRPILLVQGDLWRDLPFPPSSFDAVLALHGTLAHPPSRDALAPFAREVRRVLAPGGTLVVEAPSPRWADAMAADFARTGPAEGVYTDGATGRSIGVVLFDEAAWREALSPVLDVTLAREEGLELFLTASRR